MRKFGWQCESPIAEALKCWSGKNQASSTQTTQNEQTAGQGGGAGSATTVVGAGGVRNTVGFDSQGNSIANSKISGEVVNITSADVNALAANQAVSLAAIEAAHEDATTTVNASSGLAAAAVTTSNLTEQDALQLLQEESAQFSAATQATNANAATLANNAVTQQSQPINQLPVLAQGGGGDQGTNSVNKVIVITSIIGTIAALIYLFRPKGTSV